MLHQRRGTTSQSSGGGGGLSVATGGDYSYSGSGYGNGGSYTGYPQQQQYTASAPRRPQDTSSKTRRYPGETPWWRKYIVHLLLGGLLLISVVTSRVSYGRLQKKYQELLKEESLNRSLMTNTHESRNAELLREVSELRRKVSQVETERDALKHEHHETKVTLEEHQDMHHSLSTELEYSQNKETEVMKNFKFLTNYIQSESYREILERFGEGPHRVKFTVEFFTDVSYEGSGPASKQVPERSFVIQLAPINVMPHAVHLFLEQVDHKLWDGCAFVINAQHVIQASPVAPNFLGDTIQHLDKLSGFRNARLDKLAYSEFSEDYHHMKWTVGFAGRPSGPDWYINLSDNMDSHGPGVQQHHAFTDDADPCFGEVIEGFDVIEEMRKQETAHGMFVKYVHLKSAVILKGSTGSTISTSGEKISTHATTDAHASGMVDGIPANVNLPKNFEKDSKMEQGHVVVDATAELHHA
mmetsp:Transcript_20713/g.29530  ORF Transcript_20713/g.29530 Transcript_20713/m.29530 type:complete len:469 (-) Transcript_20713:156-1562(-)|eukprot:CAMPEP_0172425376 /NCGR_PEP_ID=MMETSP1064-20121228/31731_1 /TAXON_ID=202472 /ORGANISM="Aulacoseira subarctica , Strain CCAP 1002/5" /LENGTH=468 /DNA_ID=CAMNT_0013168187 /DNA_START=98 /DNA_END=1504 /DNA_ORIENTATION=-